MGTCGKFRGKKVGIIYKKQKKGCSQGDNNIKFKCWVNC